MQQGEILMLGASGKVGRLMRAHWPASGPRALWQGRSIGAAPGWVPWAPGQPLPEVPVVALIAGVTAGAADELAANTRIGLDLVQALPGSAVRHVLLFSTMALYGRTPPGGATEDTLPDRPNPYGLSKWHMEQAMAQAMAGRGVGLTALRIGNVAGADLLGARVARGMPITLDRFDDGHGPVRSYAGAGLLARVVQGLTAHVLSGARLPGVLNVAGQAPIGMDALMQAAGLPFTWVPAGPNAAACIAMDCRRLAALVPPVPHAETAEGVAAEWTGRAA